MAVTWLYELSVPSKLINYYSIIGINEFTYTITKDLLKE